MVDRAKHLLVDTMGCALGAAKSQPAVIARTMVHRVISRRLK
ncbi:MAG: hypothetical protein ACE5H7_16250 [Acidiferrobacterales bacterium]